MNTLRILSLAAVLALPVSGAAFAADQAVGPVASHAVGQWLRAPDGHIIGSVRSLSADGRTATVLIGSYFEQGSHEAQVPVSALALADGRVTLQRQTVQALNLRTR